MKTNTLLIFLKALRWQSQRSDLSEVLLTRRMCRLPAGIECADRRRSC